MEIKDMEVFQTDSELVNLYYRNTKNYIIKYNKKNNNKYCAIYFSSNNIYFPNTKDSFIENIKNKDKYEWYKTRVSYVYKHIFIRDIKKQWYLTGINSQICNPILLSEFLKKETNGYKIITIGSSAGGFAAVLFGSILKADLIFSFNGQMEINSLLKTSSEDIDPVLFRYSKRKYLKQFFDLKQFIKRPKNIFYFYSKYSKWDSEQFNHIKEINLNFIGFKTSHHGIPFLNSNLPYVINLKNKQLKKHAGKSYFPLVFSIKYFGLSNTIIGLYQTIKKVIIRYFG